MIKNILQVYALFVCLIAVFILIISSSLSLNLVTNLSIPEYRYYSYLRHYDSNELYIQYYDNKNERQHNDDADGSRQAQKVTSLQQLSPTQLEEKRIAERKQFLEEKKANNTTDLILTLQWILVAVIFFFIHWKVYRKSEKQTLSS